MAFQKIEWEAFDHIKEEKSSDWFWIVGTVAVAIATLSIFFNNLLLALLVLLATFTAFMLANSAPRIVSYSISRKGVNAGDILYTYSSIESFFIIDEDGYDRDRILLKSKRWFLPLIVVPLGEDIDMDLDDLRDILAQYMEEEEMYEPFSERIMSWLGF